MSSTIDTSPARSARHGAVHVDGTTFRQALSQFATGVTVVTTARPDGSLLGVTINSFNSVSLDPPLILWSLAHSSSTMAAFREADHYVVNVLSVDQMALARRFSKPGTASFDNLTYTLTPQGVPQLAGSVAWFVCRQRRQYSEGDHVIFIGEVVRCHAHPHGTLGFHRGRFIAI